MIIVFQSPAQWHTSLSYTGEIFANSTDFINDWRSLFNSTEEPSFIVAQAAATGIVFQTGNYLQVIKSNLIASILALRQATSFSQTEVANLLRGLNISTFYGPVAFDSAGNVTTALRTKVV